MDTGDKVSVNLSVRLRTMPITEELIGIQNFPFYFPIFNGASTPAA